MKIDYKLRGFNLLKFNCSKDVIVHPETCAKMVMMDHDGTISLEDWITGNGEYSLYHSLSEWLTNNLSDNIEVDAAWHSSYNGLTDLDSVNIGYIASATDNPVRIPFATSAAAASPMHGLIQVGTNLQITSDGVLFLKKATTTELGGIKVGYTAHDNYLPVEIDTSGRAYVNIGNSEVESYLMGWNYDSADTFKLEMAPTVYYQHDIFDNIDLYDDFGYTISRYFDNVTSIEADKIYPIRTDANGKMYTYVAWHNTTYVPFSGANAGLVPSASNIANKSTSFLNANGTWTTPTDTTYGVFSASRNGLVPSPPVGETELFLKSNGYWDTPTDTTYEGDETTIVIDEDNTITAPHQYNIVDEVIDVENYLHDYVSLGIICMHFTALKGDTLSFDNNIEMILNYIAGFRVGTSGKIIYDAPLSGRRSVTMGPSGEFISKYTKGEILLVTYGDILATYNSGNSRVEFLLGNGTDPIINTTVFDFTVLSGGVVSLNITDSSQLKIDIQIVS